jgi:hypothetical protein
VIRLIRSGFRALSLPQLFLACTGLLTVVVFSAGVRLP